MGPSYGISDELVDTHAITLRFEMLYEIEKTVLGSNNLAL